MSCEDYNLIKEGDLRNSLESGTTVLEADAIRALYDGDTASIATTISGSPAVISLFVEFGEAFDLCYVDYYTDETDITNIQINYGDDITVSGSVLLNLTSSGVYRGVINYHACFVQLRHTVSGTVANINQLEIIGIQNETLGFGGGAGEEINHLYMPHATIGTLSASSTAVPLFNDNDFDDVAKISVAPTNTLADDYIYVSTSVNGTYYGINDYGFRQPGSQHNLLHDDDFASTTIDSQWEVRSAGGQHVITPTPEGLYFDVERAAYYSASRQNVGIISKEYFTAASFTAEVDIRFLGVYDEEYYFYRDIFMVLTNNFPIPGIGTRDAWAIDEHHGAAIGGLTLRVAGLNVYTTTETLETRFRWVDGVGESPESVALAEEWSKGYNSASVGKVLGPTLDAFQDVVYEGNDFGDLGSSAEWHRWRLVYDHVKQELSGYINNIFIGSRIFRYDSFKEGCKLFIGSEGTNGFKWELRNFKMYANKIYRQTNVALDVNGGVVSATVSGTEDNVGAANDGDISTAYVGPNPDSLTHLRVDFDQEYDVVYYRLKQRDNDQSIVAFGDVYWPDVARTAIVSFGGKGTPVHGYPNVIDSANKAWPRSPTYSGRAVVASGVSYVELQFVDYDRTGQANNALIVEEFEVYAEEIVTVSPPEPENDREIPWSEGRWINLEQQGFGSPVLVLKDRSYAAIEAGYRPVPEYFQAFVDYGFSSAVCGRQYADPDNDYHHAESLFSGPEGVHSGDYDQWHSGVQYDNNIYLWRYFSEMRRVKAVYWDSATLRPSNIVNKFKFQYLKDEGDPKNNDDWVDITPISIPHPYNTGDDLPYKEYKDYIIANNDGEFYTDYKDTPAPSDGNYGFSVIGSSTYYPRPQGLVVPSVYTTSQSAPLDFETANIHRGAGLAGYIEFDGVVRTRGIRFVVDTVVTYGGDPANKIALAHFKIFSTDATGSYVSPVFDTGTTQNTERVRAVVRDVDGSSSAVYVRSSSVAPTLLYDPQYEMWRNFGSTGWGDVSFPVWPALWDRAVSVGDNTYFSMSAIPYIYNHVTDSWSVWGGGYPAGGVSTEDFAEDEGIGSTVSPGYLPDDRVRGHTALLDDGVIYVVCYATGDTRHPRMMKYLFANTADALAGWNIIGSLRPLESEHACMVPYERRLYFFGDSGAVSYFNTIDEQWVVLSVSFPVYGGDRDDSAACTFEDKAYIFGCSSIAKQVVDIFDFETETFITGAPLPFPMLGGQAIPVLTERVIYLFPQNYLTTGFNATMKYFPDEDRWEVVEGLMWWRDVVGYQNEGRACYYKDGYIYSFPFNDKLARTKVRRDSWRHGKSPDFRDSVWGGPESLTNIPWKKVDDLGELMPQERYFQFKVELYSEDREHSSSLESVTVVTPQDISVPASGTADAFVKIGVSPDSSYQAWYTGNSLGWDEREYSIIYTSSVDGAIWGAPVLASGTWSPDSGELYSVSSPWVIKEDPSSYEYWFTYKHTDNYIVENSIYQCVSDVPFSMSGELAVEAVAEGAVVKTEGGAYQPCVIKRSSTDYKMWYTGEDSGSVRRIFYATYSGSGSWGDIQLCLDIGADAVNDYDQKQVYRPSVIEDNGIFRMWCTGTGSDDKDRILYSYSVDGISWTVPVLAFNINSEGNGLDRFGASNPMVVLDGSIYIMYYIGYDGVYSYVLRAVSPDGLAWFEHAIVFPSFGVEGEYDVAGILDFFVVVNRTAAIPGEVMTTAKLKIYNEGASL